MGIINAFKEFAYGLKLGTSYSLSNRQGFAEKISNPAMFTKDPGH